MAKPKKLTTTVELRKSAEIAAFAISLLARLSGWEVRESLRTVCAFYGYRIVEMQNVKEAERTL